MASNVEIANRALQKLGAKRIVSLTEDSRNGRAVNACFEIVKRSVLTSHPWSAAIKRVQLAADSSGPDFGPTNSYTLPSDFLRLLPPDPDLNQNDLDWQIEGRKILTDDSAPLDVRYIYDVTDPNEMGELLREAISMKIAYELAEELTQSNSKKQEAFMAYKEAIAEAKRANAIQRVSPVPPDDEWITVRN